MKAFTPCIYVSFLVWLWGCPGPLLGEMPPDKSAYFPAALLQNGDQLFVVSSNFDHRYAGGTILAWDLREVDARLKDLVVAEPDAKKRTIVPQDLNPQNLVRSSLAIPSFAKSPIFTPTKSRMLLLSGARNELIEVNVGAEGRLSCGGLAPSQDLGQDCIEDSIASRLPWADPFYLQLLPSSSDQVLNGLIGYLSLAKREKIEPDRISLTKDYGELQTFTWKPAAREITLGRSILLQDLLPADIKAPDSQPASPVNPAPATPASDSTMRRISRIGGMRLIGNRYVLLGVEALVSYGDTISTKKNARLVWFEVSELEKNPIDRSKVADFNFTTIMNAEAINGFDILDRRGDGSLLSVYAILDEPSALVRVDMQVNANGDFDARYVRQRVLCEKPSAVRVSPDQRTVLVACEKSNELMAYDSDSLSIVGRDSDDGQAFGRGPVQIWFDERPEFQLPNSRARAYVSYFFDGSIGVFDVSSPSLGQVRLSPVGRIGQQAPLNHAGGI